MTEFKLPYELLEEKMHYYETLYKKFELKYMLLDRLQNTELIRINTETRLAGEKVYIYGAGTLGVSLYRILKKMDSVEVAGFIERDTSGMFEGETPVYSLRDDEIQGDAVIIITPMDYYNEICSETGQYCKKNRIIPLTELAEG